MEDCVFCKIVKGDIPSHKIWEDEDHLAILSIFPNTKGFTVVLTKKHFPSYAFENSDKTLIKLVLATKKVARILDCSFEDVGICGMFFEGFGVDHLHSKLYPMHGTAHMDKRKPIISASKKDFYKIYPGYLSSHDSERAGDELLKKTAEKIRMTAKRLKL